MTTINLKDLYYWYTQDQLIEVSDEVAEVFKADARYEMAYQRRLSRHKAQYSLDCDDGIEYSACLHEPCLLYTSRSLLAAAGLGKQSESSMRPYFNQFQRSAFCTMLCLSLIHI